MAYNKKSDIGPMIAHPGSDNKNSILLDTPDTSIELQGQSNSIGMEGTKNSIQLELGQNSIAMDAGQNSVALNGDTNSIDLQSNYNSVNLDSNYNSINLDTQGNSVSLDSQGNSINLEGTTQSVQMQGQDNSVSMQGQDNSVSMNADTQSVTLDSQLNSTTMQTQENSVNIGYENKATVDVFSTQAFGWNRYMDRQFANIKEASGASVEKYTNMVTTGTDAVYNARTSATWNGSGTAYTADGYINFAEFYIVAEFLVPNDLESIASFSIDTIEFNGAGFDSGDTILQLPCVCPVKCVYVNGVTEADSTAFGRGLVIGPFYVAALSSSSHTATSYTVSGCTLNGTVHGESSTQGTLCKAYASMRGYIRNSADTGEVSETIAYRSSTVGTSEGMNTISSRKSRFFHVDNTASAGSTTPALIFKFELLNNGFETATQNSDSTTHAVAGCATYLVYPTYVGGSEISGNAMDIVYADYRVNASCSFSRELSVILDGNYSTPKVTLNINKDTGTNQLIPSLTINNDLGNIDYMIDNWHEIYDDLLTDVGYETTIQDIDYNYFSDDYITVGFTLTHGSNSKKVLLLATALHSLDGAGYIKSFVGNQYIVNGYVIESGKMVNKIDRTGKTSLYKGYYALHEPHDSPDEPVRAGYRKNSRATFYNMFNDVIYKTIDGIIELSNGFAPIYCSKTIAEKFAAIFTEFNESVMVGFSIPMVYPMINLQITTDTGYHLDITPSGALTGVADFLEDQYSYYTGHRFTTESSYYPIPQSVLILPGIPLTEGNVPTTIPMSSTDYFGININGRSIYTGDNAYSVGKSLCFISNNMLYTSLNRFSLCGVQPALTDTGKYFVMGNYIVIGNSSGSQIYYVDNNTGLVNVASIASYVCTTPFKQGSSLILPCYSQSGYFEIYYFDGQKLAHIYTDTHTTTAENISSGIIGDQKFFMVRSGSLNNAVMYPFNVGIDNAVSGCSSLSCSYVNNIRMLQNGVPKVNPYLDRTSTTYYYTDYTTTNSVTSYTIKSSKVPNQFNNGLSFVVNSVIITFDQLPITPTTGDVILKVYKDNVQFGSDIDATPITKELVKKSSIGTVKLSSLHYVITAKTGYVISNVQYMGNYLDL